MRPLAATSTAMRGVADWPAIWRSAHSGPGRLCVIPDPGLARYFLRVGMPAIALAFKYFCRLVCDDLCTYWIVYGHALGIADGLRLQRGQMGSRC